MVTTELGACEWFVWDLRRSNLIDRGQLDQVVSEFLQQNPRAEPAQLAEYLVHQGIISQFQAERLLQGKTQGFVLGPFTLMDALGVGSMGTVYKAVSKTDNQWYAVKVLPRRSMWNVRIARRKVRAFEACRHPTVVPFVDVGTSGGMHYLSWPYVEGETLEKKVQREGKLGCQTLIDIAFQLAEGLEVCHQQGLFHGLLKPSNVMVGPENGLYILDFGIGCLLAEAEGESLVDTMSTANSVASGLDCASPESIMDPTNLTPVGDQYSLGCVMYFCLTGCYPFPDGSAAEKMMAHQFKQPTPIRDLNPQVPQELVSIVERLMQKAPEKRFATSAELVEALRALAGDAAQQIRSEPSRWGTVLSAPTTETPPLGGTPRHAMPTITNLPPLRGKAAPNTTSQPAVPTIAASAVPRSGTSVTHPADGHSRQAPPASQPRPPRPAMPTMQNLQRPTLKLKSASAPATGSHPTPSLPGRPTSRNELPRLPQRQMVPFTPSEDRVIPGGFDDEPILWQQRLRTAGVAAGALVAAVLAWFVASNFF
jgi:serine/threonine-protein kinase